MKFALAQIDVIPGQPQRNIRQMLEMIAQAKKENVDLIIFPELCVSGYVLSDTWVNETFCENLMRLNELILEASEGIAIAYGNIFLDKDIQTRWNHLAPHPNKDGRTRKYNAVYVVQNGKPAQRIKENNVLPAGVQPKTLLPEYRIFDDERYFFSLQDVAKDIGVSIESLAQPFLIQVKEKQIPIGFEICEDLWCSDYRKNGESLNITNILIQNGAGVIVNISASPWNHGKNAARDERIRYLKQEAGKYFVPFLYVNNVGAQNNGKNIVTFDGATTVYNHDGLPLLLTEQSYKEELVIFEDTLFAKAPVVRKEEPKMQRKFEAIAQGIRHMELLKPSHIPLQFVIGLSGGIDSAVVAALLTLVCGKENVIAINMPSKYNVDKTKNAARQVAERLGIEYQVVPIQQLYDQQETLFNALDKKYMPAERVKALSNENIQAKIRGTSILSNFAGRYGRFFSCNGNKLEIALGYTTLYGDVNGALAPIGDLTKSEVYEMGRFLNQEIFGEEVLPSVLFPDHLFRFDDRWIVPSAELKNNQVDPMKIGYHCALLEAFTDYIRKTPEAIMEWYLEGTMEKNLGIPRELIQRWGVDDPQTFVSDLEWFSSSIQKNVFKRIQAPPIIITSRSAYGYDHRESMLPRENTLRYEELKARILKGVVR